MPISKSGRVRRRTGAASTEPWCRGYAQAQALVFIFRAAAPGHASAWERGFAHAGGWPLALARTDSCAARRQKILSLPIGARRPRGGGMWVGHGWVGVEELSSRPSPNDAVATVAPPPPLCSRSDSHAVVDKHPA